MKKYLSFFRMRFFMGLQYRTAAIAGLSTQFFWGAMEVLLYMAFYRADPGAFPMTLSATIDYIWLQQAFLMVFAAWIVESEIVSAIKSGDVAYELCRPVRIYDMWFAKSMAGRVSKAALRCWPIIVVALLLPEPYGLSLPHSPRHFALFLVALVMSLLVAVAFYMLVYGVCFFTVSVDGIRMVTMSVVEFLSGGGFPLPFFPDPVRRVLEVLPFAAMQNVPLRVYSGSMSDAQMAVALGLQVFWLVALGAAGRLLFALAVRRATLQGG